MEFREVFFGFKQVFSGRLALSADKVFQLVDVAAPFKSIEELEAGELSFVEGTFAVAGA